MSGTSLPALQLAGVVIGMRELVLALILIVAAYIGFVLYRMHRLGGDDAVPVPAPVSPPPTSAPVLHQEQPGADTARHEPATGGSASSEPAGLEYQPSGMASELMFAGLERELAQVRDEVDVMRGELSALREDMLQALAQLRATQTMSPIYGDAMQMAVAGYDAVLIAERCGIARAEAELVVALARSQAQ